MKMLAFKTELIFGEKPLDYLREVQAERIFVVCDPFLVQSGLLERIKAPLGERTVFVFDRVTPDPSVALVAEGVAAYRAFAPDLALAVGGGSAIDAAKAIVYLARDGAAEKGVDLLAIPTTSGTGSEVTSFAVITDKARGVKFPLVSPALLPRAAILDGELVRTVPQAVVADTGMDVLTHALEAYVSTKATDFSDALAEKAVTLVFAYLLRSYGQADDQEARLKLHHASTLAGMAFNEASLGVNHALAHGLGARSGLPHGRVNAMLLPHVVAYNAQLGGYAEREFTQAARKYAHLARLCGWPTPNVRAAVRKLVSEIVKLQKLLKLPCRLADCQLTTALDAQSREEIARLALEDECLKTNPRPVSVEDCQRILAKIW